MAQRRLTATELQGSRKWDFKMNAIAELKASTLLTDDFADFTTDWLNVENFDTGALEAIAVLTGDGTLEVQLDTSVLGTDADARPVMIQPASADGDVAPEPFNGQFPGDGSGNVRIELDLRTVNFIRLRARMVDGNDDETMSVGFQGGR